MKSVFFVFPNASVVERELLDMGHEMPVWLSNQVCLWGDFEASQIRNLTVVVRKWGRGYSASVLTERRSIAWFECFELSRVIEALQNFSLSRSQILCERFSLEEEFAVAAARVRLGGEL